MGVFNELALFAGIGGGIWGGKFLGWRTVCAVENDCYAATVLAQRQNDGTLEPFPIWSDVRTFDGRAWRGRVDVISGGFPCQDISIAGKHEGIDGSRSGLWSEMARIVSEVMPRRVFVENAPTLVDRGLGRILADFSNLGFDAEWGVFGAHSVGAPPAPHSRKRLWILAYPASARREARKGNEIRIEPGKGKGSVARRGSAESNGDGITWWASECGLDRVAHGDPYWCNRVKAIGNAQVPAVAALAYRELSIRAGIDIGGITT